MLLETLNKYAAAKKRRKRINAFYKVIISVDKWEKDLRIDIEKEK